MTDARCKSQLPSKHGKRNTAARWCAKQ